jgi:hypothetical protein
VSTPAGPLASVFGALPPKLRDELLSAFNEIVKNYRERRWEPAELNGGKLCEVVYSIVKGHIDGTYPPRAKKPPRMNKACEALEQTPAAAAPRSIRVQIPRMLIALYEFRNNRNVGHVGGDVDPNHMDAVCVLQMSKWLMAELVRVLHNVDTDEATKIVDGLVDRETPLIWQVGGKRRVMNTTLSMRDGTLLLLHAANGPVAETDLVSWLEHSNSSVYRRDVLRRAHKARLIEYDAGAKTAEISPTGITYVEQNLLPAVGV